MSDTTNPTTVTTTGTAATATTAGGTTATTTSTTTVGSDGIVIDKNKLQEQYITEAESKYIIPALVREKFPDLVKLIYETESMNEEEREYWMQILPIMSEEQIVKFRDILVNERNQLQKLDTEYEQEMARIANGKKEIDENAIKQKMQEIRASEQSSKNKEQEEGEQLLKNLENL